MAYQRVPVDPNAPLRPGKTYEIVAAHKGGDVSRVTRANLERALQAKYGPGVRVLDWGKRGNDLVIRLKVETTSSSAGTSDPWAVPPAYGGAGCGSTKCPQPMGYLGGGDIYPAFLPLALSAAAVIAVAIIGYMMLVGRFDWRRGIVTLVGIFIIFGAVTIVAGLRSLAGG